MADDGTSPEPPRVGPDDPRVGSRADLLGEELAAGSDDPVEQAEIILDDSEERLLERESQLEDGAERRRSEDLVDPDA